MNDYEQRQRLHDAQYKEAWDKLTPAQRRELARAGVAGPELPTYHTCRVDDTALLEQAPCAPAETPGEAIEGSGADSWIREAGELLKAFLFRIIDQSTNPRLEAECISLAFGYGAAKGINQTAVANRYGLTRAAVSKRVREIKELFELPPSEYMKSDRARAIYSLTNKPRT